MNVSWKCFEVGPCVGWHPNGKFNLIQAKIAELLNSYEKQNVNARILANKFATGKPTVVLMGVNKHTGLNYGNPIAVLK